MMAAVATGDTGLFSIDSHRSSGKVRKHGLTEREKKQVAQKYVEHEFVIHGEKIMARNKKTAMKIYANRHKK